MDEFQRGYERERGAASYRAKATCLGCLVAMAFAVVLLIALMLVSAFLTFAA
jgi:hypothetical protein